VSKSTTTLASLNEAYEEHFGKVTTLSALRKTYQDAATSASSYENEPLSLALATTVDAVYSVECDVATFEKYVTLTLPKMEDGNNFGVTIQLQVLKHLQELKEKLSKGMEELSKYSSSRADALDKCGLPTQTKTSTATESDSAKADTGGEKGDTKTTSKGTSKEEKTTATETKETPGHVYRKKAVIECDVLYFTKARSLFQVALTGYLGILDFMDKNKEKIEKPKGSQGTGGYTGMY